MTIALFIGRFQPFHLGHLWAVKNILEECDEVIIAIGSAQEEGTKENPYSADERKDMIDAVMEEEKIINYRVVAVDDINDNARWADHVLRWVGHVDVVYTGNPLTKKLFSEQGYDVQQLEMHQNINATEIRELFEEGENIATFVPKKVLELMRKPKQRKDL